RPPIGCLINLTADHLDRHGSFEVYAATKARLFARQGADDFAVLNRDDAEVWRLASHLPSRVVSFGSDPAPSGAFAGDRPVVLRAGGVDKGGSYAPLAEAAAGKVRLALVFGAARGAIAAALVGRDVAVEHVSSLDAAVQAAAAHARPGDVVLLAPACSSFD